MFRVVWSKGSRSLKWNESGCPGYFKPSESESPLYSIVNYRGLHPSRRSHSFQNNHQVISRPRKHVCQSVLEHFDQQYHEELGQLWSTAREVLLSPQSWQYGVMLNRFTASEELKQRLQVLGYFGLFPRDQGSLQCFIHEAPIRFPSQKHRAGQLKQYYLLNAASLLPVLALDVKQGERVLDLCSSPGGKAVAILQSATPVQCLTGLLHCNELDCHRRNWLAKTMESFIPQALSQVVKIFNLDGRVFGQRETGAYDKVLVDSPCSNDRSWLFSGQPRQAALRLRERADLPAMQKQLLRSALGALRPGGTAVYSTCTLSRAENGAVVEEVLTTCPDVELQDLTELACSLQHRFTFHRDPSGGLLVVPDRGRTWGPTFVAKMKKRP